MSTVCCRDWWVATKSYTARCPVGRTGSPVTVTRQYRSLVSLEDAEIQAEKLAKREAEAELVCLFSSTQCAQPPCPEHPDPVCVTATSSVSLLDASLEAIRLARLAVSVLCSSPET